VWENHPAAAMDDVVFSKCSKAINSLNWGKLPTSTSTGLIQLIAEFDDTVATFTKKFWSSLSYGSFKWGVMPLISDLMGIANALKNLNQALDSFKYHDTMEVDLTQPAPSSGVGFYIASGTAKVTKNGKGDISFQHPGAIALDRLGFHPRLSTAWDLVPLSFMVDYILPIGEMLSSYESSGWIGAVYFKGWLTIKAEYFTVNYNFAASSVTCPPASVKQFFRWPYSDVLIEVPPEKKLLSHKDILMPSLSQMFSLFYALILPKLSKKVQKAVSPFALGTAIAEDLKPF
jgi:hypothetical protein